MEQRSNGRDPRQMVQPIDVERLTKHWVDFDYKFETMFNDLKANVGRPPIVAIHGLAGSGKSTVASYLARKIPLAIVIPLALPVKNLAASMGWRGQKDEKGRKLLQMLGTELVKDLIDPMHWMKLWTYSAHANREAKIIICDDLRFPDEMAFFKKLRAKTVWVTGRGGLGATNAMHRSEAGLRKGFDYKIENEGTKAELEAAVDKLLAEVISE